MSGLLYFIQGVDTGSDEAIKKAGLEEVFGTDSRDFRGASSGPGTLGGVIVAVSQRNQDIPKQRIGYYPEDQTWQEVEKGKYWIGMNNTRPLLPEGIERTEQIDGHWVELNDGNKWLIPVARKFDQGTVLPRALILGPEGELVAEILPKYVQFWKKVEKVYNNFIDAMKKDDSDDALTVQEGWDIAVEAMQYNYAINKWGISFRRLLTTENVKAILEAIVDIPTLLEVDKEMSRSGKKKESAPIPDGSSLNDGEQDESTPTTPPTPTSDGSVNQEVNA